MVLHSIGDRLRSERERLKLSQAALAEYGGVKPLTQHSYEKGSSYPNADYLARVNDLGIDAMYVITGARAKPAQALPGSEPEMAALMALQNRGIYPDGEGGGRVSSAGLALLLDYVREVKDNRITKLTKKELQKVVNFVPKDSREWVIQPVALTPYPDGKASHILLVYRKRSPVSVVWKVGPFQGDVPSRIDITTGSELPLRSVGEEDDDELRWQLDLSLDGANSILPQGLELRANPLPIDYTKPQAEEGKSVRIHIGGDVGQAVSGDQIIHGAVHIGTVKKRDKS